MTTAAILVRVSSAEQVEGYSLDAQRRACRDLCAARGYEIAEEYAEEGRSAFVDQLTKRPNFLRMLADAERGLFTVLVVHKLDRFARNQGILHDAMKRMAKAGAVLVSVTEPAFDYTTPNGFLSIGIQGTINEWYSRNLSEETKKGWRERKLAGLWAGRLPFGVMKGPDGVPVPDTRPILINGAVTSNHVGLLLAFARAAEGATDSEVAAALNAIGYKPNPTAIRQRFGRDALRTILANRFYVGELPVGKRGKDGWIEARHEAIVPLDLFEAAQVRRQQRAIDSRVYHVAKNRSIHALSGLVRCGHCGETMQQSGKPRLICRARRQGVACESRSVLEWIIEDEIALYLAGLRFPADMSEHILAAYQHHKPEISERAQRRGAIEGQMRRLADVYVSGDMPKADYEARRSELRAELNRLQETDVHARPDTLAGLERYLSMAPQLWLGTNAEGRNRIGRALFEAVYVRDQHLAEIQPRPEFQPYFALAGHESASVSGGASASMTRRARGDSNSHRQSVFTMKRIAV